MGFRQLLRRAVKPAAMVGVVGMLSVSMIVTTPSNAQAFGDGTKLPVKETWVMGAAKTVAPVAMAAVSVTPIGWALRLGQLGFLAYSTSDMWMPFVTGAWGAATGPSAPAGAAAAVHRDLKITKMEKGQYAHAVTVFMEYTGNDYQNGALFDVAGRVTCRYDGVTSTFNVTTSGNFGRAGGNYTSTPAPALACPHNGYVMLGAIAGPFAGSGDLVTCPSGSCHPGPENVFKWGSEFQDGDPGFDPLGEEVGYQGKSECIDSGGTISWVTGPAIPGNNGAMLMPSCEAAGKGHGTGRTTVTGFRPDGGTETVWDTGAQPLMDPATPLCDPGRATSGCVLEVTKDGQPCATGDVECENWAQESQKENNTRYGCKLGPYVMPLSACSLLERAYHPGGSPLNDPNTDGNPSTSSSLGPSGQPAVAPAPATTGTTTGVSPVPGGSGQAGPGAEPGAAACWPSGWGMLNPLEWVYKPVVCAAKALFQPQKNMQTRVTAMAATFENKVPVSWFGIDVAGASGGGCPVSWAVEFQGTSHSLICGTQAENIILGLRPVLGAMLIMAMLWPLIRSLFYSAIPVFKVTPS